VTNGKISVADDEGVSAGMPSHERRSQLKLRRSPERNPSGERLRREQRLRSPRDFQRVRAQGKRVSGGLLSLGYVAQAEPGWTRFGLSVSRRVGGAVVRNRVKRRLREIVRRKLADIAPGFDLVITARAGAADARIEALDQETRTLLSRARLLRAETHRGAGL
jgi:ribonuclease P protein component